MLVGEQLVAIFMASISLLLLYVYLLYFKELLLILFIISFGTKCNSFSHKEF